MLIAQVSDTHLVRPGELLADGMDSAAQLERVVECIACLDTRPDCVLATGDLADRGEPEAYSLLRALLAPLAVPVYAIPGNHDRREALRAAFSDCAWMPAAAGTPIAYAVEVPPLRILALDTLVEGEERGVLGEDQLAWLDARLGEAASVPVIVMLHHPPVNCGVDRVDALKLTQPERLGAIVARHPHIERILCGHLHRSLHLRWQGTTVSVAPSTADQLHMAFQPGASIASTAEPPGFQLHYWHETDRLVTQTFALPFPSR